MGPLNIREYCTGSHIKHALLYRSEQIKLAQKSSLQEQPGMGAVGLCSYLYFYQLKMHICSINVTGMLKESVAFKKSIKKKKHYCPGETAQQSAHLLSKHEHLSSKFQKLHKMPPSSRVPGTPSTEGA